MAHANIIACHQIPHEREGGKGCKHHFLAQDSANALVTGITYEAGKLEN
jgi:hypothetical protein